jgi:phosphoribosylaminoimidazole-succinocarboxamide synthase
MNVFWRRHFGGLFPHDLAAYGAMIDDFLPPSLKGDSELQARATVVHRLNMLPIEAIVRGLLTGSGLEGYKESGSVCGHKLPGGLHDGSKLPYPIFTPSTKAAVGHDENISVAQAEILHDRGSEPERLALQLYMMAAAYARKRGILIPDTKFEFGVNVVTGKLSLGDEVATPDSSRYWSEAEWFAAQEMLKSPSGFDKQPVRNWGQGLGINKRNPEVDEDVAWVHAQEVPANLVAATSQRYRWIFDRLTGMRLEVFQRSVMRINITPKLVNVEVFLGSLSDRNQASEGLEALEQAEKAGLVAWRLHFCSADRNREELAKHIANLDPAVDVIIAGAGRTAILPSALHHLLRENGREHIPVFGIGFEGSAEDTEAARLAIKRGLAPVQYAGHDGEQWIGPAGFKAACRYAVEHETLPPPPMKMREAIMGAQKTWREYVA